MATVVTTPTTAKDGRLALKEGDKIIGFGRFEVAFVPPGSDGAILEAQFILEPRSEDRTNEALMLQAHGATE